MTPSQNFLRRFAVRGVFWREYLDWATVNMPFFTYPVLHFFMTFFFFFFAAPARRTVLAHLAIILPGTSRAMNYLRVFRTFHNYSWTISEAAIHKLNKEEFAYEIIGPEWLDQLGAARGAIVLTAHMGSYDLGAALFVQKFNREIRVVRAPEPDQQTAQHLSASLEKSGEGGVKVDYNTAGALLSLDLLNALRLGEIVSIQGDRLLGDLAKVRGRLFGKEVWLPNGPFVLAQVSRAPIYPLFIARAAYRSYQIIVRDPFTVLRTGRDRDEDIARAVEKWCGVLEQLLRERWDQWYAFGPGFLADEQKP
jgi:lauroyl/myristoyl acyltransferase